MLAAPAVLIAATRQQQQHSEEDLQWSQPAEGCGAFAAGGWSQELEPGLLDQNRPQQSLLEQLQLPGKQQQQQDLLKHEYRHHHNHQAALQGVKSRLVQFHGEMVLLLHWSLLNYAAVVKILKKHDKRTRVLLRAPYLANVLQQVRDAKLQPFSPGCAGQ